MIEFLTLCNLFLAGFLVSAVFSTRYQGRLIVDWSYILKSVLWSVILISVTGIILLELNSFFLTYFHVIFGLINLVLLILNWKKKTLRGAFSTLSIRLFGFVFILLLILNVFLKTPVSNYVHGGQDEGIYVNVANELARTGDVWLNEPLLKESFANPEMTFLQKYYGFSPKLSVRKDRFEGWRNSAYYIVDKEEGLLVPQFYHLHPIWMALSASVLGQENTAISLFFFAMLTIAFFFLFLDHFLKNKWISLFCVFLYSINIFTFWINKFPVSETVAFFFLLTGLFYLYLLYSGEEQKNLEYSLLSGFSLGLFSFVRGDGLLFLPLFVLIYLFLPYKRSFSIIFNICFIFLGWSTLHALKYLFPYFFDVMRGEGLGFVFNYGWFWHLLFFVFFVVAINIFKHYLHGLISRIVDLFRKISAKVYYVMAGVIGFLFLAIFLVKMQNYFAGFDFSQVSPWGHLKGFFFEGETYAVSFLQLIVLLGIPLSVFALVGVGKFAKHYKKAWVILLLLAYSSLFQYIYVFSQGPLFYYGRYQFLVMFPLAFLFFGVFLKSFGVKSLKRIYFKSGISVVVVFLYLASAWNNPIYAKTELDGAYQSIKDMTSYIQGGDSVVFMDTSLMPRFEVPVMYTFGKGTAYGNDQLNEIREEAGVIMNRVHNNIYLLKEEEVEPALLDCDGLRLAKLAQGYLPINISGVTTAFPHEWQEGGNSYHLYQLVSSDTQKRCNKFIEINSSTDRYSFEGLQAVTDGFAWTNGNFVVKGVALNIDPAVFGQKAYIQLKNAGFYPPELNLDLQILVNGEQICQYQDGNKRSFPFPICEIPAKFYNTVVDISVITNTWIPDKLWPGNSTDSRILGIDFEWLRVSFEAP